MHASDLFTLVKGHMTDTILSRLSFRNEAGAFRRQHIIFSVNFFLPMLSVSLLLLRAALGVNFFGVLLGFELFTVDGKTLLCSLHGSSISFSFQDTDTKYPASTKTPFND